MFAGLLLAHILLHSTRKVLLSGLELSSARKCGSLMLVSSLLISHHVKSMYHLLVSYQWNGMNINYRSVIFDKGTIQGLMYLSYSECSCNGNVNVVRELSFPI